MKMSTRVWARFESKGRPKFTETINGTIQEVIAAQIKWVAGVYMGSHIRVTIARSESELEQLTNGSAGSEIDDLMSQLAEAAGLDNIEIEDEA